MKTYRWLLLVLLLLLGTVVHAEGGCPPGMLPASGTDINSCAPAPPGYYGNQQPQFQQPLPPPPQWVSRWGAIATYEPGGVLGSATNMPSQEVAVQIAMGDCQSKGGGSKCKLEITYHDQCVALVVGDKVYNTSSAITIDQAAQSGLQRCNGASANCHVYYSACSLPVRIQ